jgi:hypothetical protein
MGEGVPMARQKLTERERADLSSAPSLVHRRCRALLWSSAAGSSGLIVHMWVLASAESTTTTDDDYALPLIW